MRAKYICAAMGFLCLLFVSCSKLPEMTLEEIQLHSQNLNESLFQKTISKPWTGGEYKAGNVGGIWYDTILSDPKTFNQLIADRDGTSASIVSMTLEYLIDYDKYKRQWKPSAASFEIETDIEKNTLTVHYKIRDDLYWTWYNSDKKVPVTSDDFVFWYNEIDGDPSVGTGNYGSQWIVMEDGSEAHIDCIKIDDKNFDFVFPRIVADPLLTTNMELCPSFITIHCEP